jgi:PKD repeat protein
VNDDPEAPVITVDNTTGLTINCSVQEVDDEDGDTLTYWWDFGDGSMIKDLGLDANHTFESPGSYWVNVTVTDSMGGLSRSSLLVNVTKPDKNGNGDDNKTDNITDTDNDGLDDDWELEHFGNLTYDSNDDVDNDGFTNLEEYEGKTDPLKETDRPITDKDKKEVSGISEGTEMFLYIIGIIGIINLVLILSIIGYLVVRKKPKQEYPTGDTRVTDPYSTGREFTIPCPECGREVAENAYKCPYCGEELGEVQRDSRREAYDRRDQTRRGPRAAAARGKGKGNVAAHEESENMVWDDDEDADTDEYDDDEDLEFDEEEPDSDAVEVDEFDEEEWDEENIDDDEEPDGPEWVEEEEDYEDEEYYDEESEPMGDDPWDDYEDDYYDEGTRNQGQYYNEYRDTGYQNDNYKPNAAWGKNQSRPAWDSGRGSRRVRR